MTQRKHTSLNLSQFAGEGWSLRYSLLKKADSTDLLCWGPLVTEGASDDGAEVGETGAGLGAIQTIRDFDSPDFSKCLNYDGRMPGKS